MAILVPVNRNRGNLSIVFIFPDVQRNMTSKNGRFEIEPEAANLELSGSSYDQWSFLTDD
jgi:hypothetical protein